MRTQDLRVKQKHIRDLKRRLQKMGSNGHHEAHDDAEHHHDHGNSHRDKLYQKEHGFSHRNGNGDTASHVSSEASREVTGLSHKNGTNGNGSTTAGSDNGNGSNGHGS